MFSSLLFSSLLFSSSLFLCLQTGLTPAERRGDVILSKKIQLLFQEKKREGNFAFKEWEERKIIFIKNKKLNDEKKAFKWKVMAKKHHEIKQKEVRKKKRK